MPDEVSPGLALEGRAMVPGAAQGDVLCLDEPLAALQQALGIDEAPRNRTLFGTGTFAYAHSGGAERPTAGRSRRG